MSSTNTEARLTPKSPNYLRNNNFKFTINKIPNVNFYVQSCNLPSLELGYRETKSQFAHPVQINGGELTYGTFNISFIVDEDLHNYMELYNWIKGQIPEETLSDIEPKAERYDDATLLILNSAYKPNLRVTFADLFPITLDAIEFDLTDSDPDPIVIGATFRFNGYKIYRL